MSSPGPACDYSEKRQKRVKYLKILAKIFKIWKYFEKGCMLIACKCCNVTLQ